MQTINYLEGRGTGLALFRICLNKGKPVREA